MKAIITSRGGATSPGSRQVDSRAVVVDGLKAFVSSANFTQRGHDWNIEAGVLMEDASLAVYLAGQWVWLIGAGIAGQYAVRGTAKLRERTADG